MSTVMVHSGTQSITSTQINNSQPADSDVPQGTSLFLSPFDLEGGVATPSY